MYLFFHVFFSYGVFQWQGFSEISVKKSTPDIFLNILPNIQSRFFKFLSFFIGTTFTIPRTSGITFDVSLEDLEKNLSAIGTTLFSQWNNFLKSTLDVKNPLKISPLENAISRTLKTRKFELDRWK